MTPFSNGALSVNDGWTSNIFFGEKSCITAYVGNRKRPQRNSYGNVSCDNRCGNVQYLDLDLLNDQRSGLRPRIAFCMTYLLANKMAGLSKTGFVWSINESHTHTHIHTRHSLLADFLSNCLLFFTFAIDLWFSFNVIDLRATFKINKLALDY